MEEVWFKFDHQGDEEPSHEAKNIVADGDEDGRKAMGRRLWTRLRGWRKPVSHGGWSGKWLGYGACGVWGCRDCR